MQKLHLVGFTATFDGLIFSARKGAKSGNYVVPLDGRLLKQIAEAERLRDGGLARPEDGHRPGSPRLVRPESSLTPRRCRTASELAGRSTRWRRRRASTSTG